MATFKRFWTVWNVTEKRAARPNMSGKWRYHGIQAAKARARECAKENRQQYAIMESVAMTPPTEPEWLEPVD